MAFLGAQGEQIQGAWAYNTWCVRVTYLTLTCGLKFPEEFVVAGDFLVYKFPVWNWYVARPVASIPTQLDNHKIYRENGDKSKIRDFLPPDKQYLVTRGVPCLRRATSLAYTDADEDAERLLSFADAGSPDPEGDEWVETHAGRKSTLDSIQNPGEIEDIPDLDGVADVTNGVSGLGLGGSGGSGKEREVSEIPDLDDIPDMEEDLEEEDEATAAPKSSAARSQPTTSASIPVSGVIDVRYGSNSLLRLPVNPRVYNFI